MSAFHYASPAGQTTHELDALVAIIVADPTGQHYLWRAGWADWRSWDVIDEVVTRVRYAQAKAEARRAVEREAVAARRLDEIETPDADWGGTGPEDAGPEDAEWGAAKPDEQDDAEWGVAAPEIEGNNSSACRIRLISYGAKKIAVIKVTRAATGLGLRDAKNLVESCPAVFPRHFTEADATRWRSDLESAGAAVEIERVRPEQQATVDGQEPTADHVVELLGLGPRKIAVIKIVRKMTGLGLKDTKDLVESYPTVIPGRHSYSAAVDWVYELSDVGAKAHHDKAQPAPARAATLTLESYGARKIAVIKVVRAATGLGLRDAKNLVESCPAVLDIASEAIDQTAAELRSAGATVRV